MNLKVQFIIQVKLYLSRFSKKKYFVFKVDFEKTCNLVNWLILEYMFVNFGFDERWRMWIKVSFLGKCIYVG